jgi:hypothetical protein
MSKQCSKPYEIGGSKYSFDIVDGKIAGIQKADSSGSFASLENTYLNPKLSTFGDIAATDEALEAYNIAKHGSNIDAYEDTAPQATSAELQNYFNKQKKKSSNESFISNDTDKPPSLAFAAPNSGAYDAYKGSRGKKHSADIFAYPLDIDPQQDHLKIQKYKYQRTQVLESNNPNVGYITSNEFNKSKTGTSVKGMKYEGGVILPMPKVEDVNGVDYGENKLGLSGLAAMGLINMSSDIVRGRRAKGSEIEAASEIRKAVVQVQSSDVQSFGESGLAAGASALANMAGANLDVNTILARTGKGVLNPSAEMLFQGPVIRDFSFKFLMVARSQKEGEEIRRIIRWFKTGAAPKYQDRVILRNPDVFKLEYRNGDGILKTTNRFLDAMALQTISVDYAPNGYWSAYRDSQPVAISLSLNFTELRPIYQDEQLKTPPDSVGL